MKLLAVGYPLPNAAIDNYNVFNAPSYFDYDAVLVDPASITRAAAQLTEEGIEFEAFDGRVVVNAPGSATVASAADLIRRRADETRRLLEAGGVVLLIARPNAVQPGVAGFEGCDRYSWLPAPSGMAWGPPFLRAAEGRTTRIVDEEHPLATLFREFRGQIAYRAIFDERQAALRQAGKVLTTGGAGTWTAVEFSVLGGRVVFLPAFSDSLEHVRNEIAQGIVDAAARLLTTATGESAPYWSRTLAVPGLEQLEAELEEAELSVTETQARLEAVRERVDSLARHRRLLYDDSVPFAAAVADALRLLGFAVTSAPGEPIVIGDEGVQAFVETETSREQVVEWPYVRLQRRLEEHLLKQGEAKKGVVIVNGHRVSQPDDRGPQYTDALRIACENYRYSLVSAQTLFTLVQRALGGADEATLGAFRRRIMRRNGELEMEAALGDAEEESETGPLF
jgi:hypothetical protein